MERERKITWKQFDYHGEILKSREDHKEDLKEVWREIKSSDDWKRLEEFGFLLVSHLTDEKKVLFFSNLNTCGNEIDSIICLNSDKWRGNALIEAKNRNKANPRDIDQISTRMDDMNIYLGFLITKSRLTGKKGQLESIKFKNAKGKKLIVPLQGPHINEFFSSDESSQDFLRRMINISKYDVLKLIISQ